MKVSVVVPFYNAAAHLEQCLDSILAQTFTDFELLLVDDCSTDESSQICDYYVSNSQVRVVHLTERLGVSTACNIGVKNARGDLIAFIDSDDFVAEDYLLVLVTTLEDYQADLVFSEFNILDQQAGMFYFNVKPEVKGQVYELTAKQAAAMPDEKLPFRHGCYVHPWGKLGKKELYLQNPFIPNLYFEDGPNSLRTFLGANKVVGLLVDNYTYRVNQTNNITQGPKILKSDMDILTAFRYRALDMLATQVDPKSFLGELHHNLTQDAYALEQAKQTNSEEYREIQWLLKLMNRNKVSE